MNVSKHTTIQDCEDAVEKTLSVLRNMDSSQMKTSPGMNILAPEGFRPVVELYEDGRKKRRTASANNWSPATGEIRIYFEPVEKAPDSRLELATDTASNPGHALSDLINALREAENSPGRMFVALKWFRDEYLPSTGLAWTRSPDDRQAHLAKAIQDGWILTSRVPNPRAPRYPTTTIRLNRQRLPEAGQAPLNRFRPVPISGEPLSDTILRERGTR